MSIPVSVVMVVALTNLMVDGKLVLPGEKVSLPESEAASLLGLEQPPIRICDDKDLQGLGDKDVKSSATLEALEQENADLYSKLAEAGELAKQSAERLAALEAENAELKAKLESIDNIAETAEKPAEAVPAKSTKTKTAAK